MANYHSTEYVEYLDSLDWKYQRELAMRRAGFRCERCFCIGKPGNQLQVHHLNYDNLGDEQKEDLQVLCEKCHRIADRERRERTAEDRYSRAMDTYCSKRWGEDWDLRSDADELEEKFEAWMNRKNGNL